MPSTGKIIILYFASTLLSGLGIVVFWVLPSVLQTKLNQGHVLAFIFCAFVTLVFAILNLIFFMSLITKIYAALSKKGIIILFYLPSLSLLVYTLISSGFKFSGDSAIVMISILINVFCISVGSYFIFANRTKEKIKSKP